MFFNLKDLFYIAGSKYLFDRYQEEIKQQRVKQQIEEAQKCVEDLQQSIQNCQKTIVGIIKELQNIKRTYDDFRTFIIKELQNRENLTTILTPRKEDEK